MLKHVSNINHIVIYTVMNWITIEPLGFVLRKRVGDFLWWFSIESVVFMLLPNKINMKWNENQQYDMVLQYIAQMNMLSDQ